LQIQWFESLACHTGADWQGWQGVDMNASAYKTYDKLKQLYGKKFRVNPMIGLPGTLGIAVYHLPQVQSTIWLYCNSPRFADKLDIIDYHTVHEPADMIIINDALHHNDPVPYAQELIKYMRRCSDVGARCVFRETTPQHFSTAVGSGLFSDRNEKKHECMPPTVFDPSSTVTFTEAGNWRNQILHSISEGFPSVKIWPLFHFLMPLSFAHVGVGPDCTHYGFNSEFWEPWHLSFIDVLNGS